MASDTITENDPRGKRIIDIGMSRGLIALIVVPLLVWIVKPVFMTRDDLLVGEGVDLSAYTVDEKELSTLAAAQ